MDGLGRGGGGEEGGESVLGTTADLFNCRESGGLCYSIQGSTVSKA